MMNTLKKISTTAVMVSMLVIVLHSVIPHHHTEDNIAVCVDLRSIADQNLSDVAHSADVPCCVHHHTQACAGGCPMVDQGSCHGDGLCGVTFSFVHSLGSENADHLLLLACLPVGYLHLKACIIEDEPSDFLCDDHRCMAVSQDVLKAQIIRRGPPVVC